MAQSEEHFLFDKPLSPWSWRPGWRGIVPMLEVW